MSSDSHVQESEVQWRAAWEVQKSCEGPHCLEEIWIHKWFWRWTECSLLGRNGRKTNFLLTSEATLFRCNRMIRGDSNWVDILSSFSYVEFVKATGWANGWVVSFSKIKPFTMSDGKLVDELKKKADEKRPCSLWRHGPRADGGGSTRIYIYFLFAQLGDGVKKMFHFPKKDVAQTHKMERSPFGIILSAVRAVPGVFIVGRSSNGFLFQIPDHRDRRQSAGLSRWSWNC